MTAAVRALIPFASITLRLHRLEAACIPEQRRSIGLLEKTGFKREGYARGYLCINGIWQDHLLYARAQGRSIDSNCLAFGLPRLACYKVQRQRFGGKTREQKMAGVRKRGEDAGMARRAHRCWPARCSLAGVRHQQHVQYVRPGSVQYVVESDHRQRRGRREAATDVECPSVDVRTGAATLMIGSKPGEGEPSALDLRYQGTIVRTARECRVSAGIMTMKVGIEGRIITGPAGGPGKVDVPLRIAVVQEGHQSEDHRLEIRARSRWLLPARSIASTLPTSILTISFPMPAPIADIDSYVVYVGFDPAGAAQEKKKPAPKSKPAQNRLRSPRQS